jgi:hypothetical protein
MPDLLSLLALLGVPAALVTLVVLAALVVTRRRSHQPPAAAAGDPAARQAWAAAYTAHVRLARLEERVRDLEHAAAAEPTEAGEWP